MAWLTMAKRTTQERDVARIIVDDRNYELVIYNKNAKVGHKPPCLAPFFTNFCNGGDARRDGMASNLPLDAAYYEDFS